MQYLIISLLLFIIMLLYLRLAAKYNIIDTPNERSSHSAATIRGGGIIFWFAALFYFILHIQTNYLFFSAITIISLISFYDDIKNLPNKIRFFVQLISLSIIFYDIKHVFDQDWWIILLTYILSVGIINAYNFMDGINGITGLYSLIVFASFYYVNENVISFVDRDFLLYPIIACIIFLFFNFRKKAKSFAGDVGSIALAIWIIYILLSLIITTNSIIWLLFLAVYGVDSTCTIIHRLFLRQNIFKPHRLHFYQILSNERGFDHRVTSLIYITIQILVSCLTILYASSMKEWQLMLLILTPLILVYLTKIYLMKLDKRSNKKNIL